MNTRDDLFSRLLADFGPHPVLVDVGASGSPPDIWTPIARDSTYVGFDPDLSEIHEDLLGGYFKKWIVNKAVVSDGTADSAPFYVTRSPFCSSTLRPNMNVLGDFLFSDLFVVEKTVRVSTTTLNQALEALGLSHIDWLKLDTQGTDLPIFKSLRADIRSGLLAVDIEPGFMDGYVGIDSFVEAHPTLTQEGFWLSGMRVDGSVRLSAETAQAVAGDRRELPVGDMERFIRKTPIWCNARYLRTLASLRDQRADERAYVLSWIFALLDGQVGFALELARDLERTAGRSTISQVLWEEAISCLEQIRLRSSSADEQARHPFMSVCVSLTKSILPMPVKRWMKSLILSVMDPPS